MAETVRFAPRHSQGREIDEVYDRDPVTDRNIP